MKKLFVATLLCPLIALAQAQPEEVKPPPPPVEPVVQPTPANPVVHPAVPVPNDWNVGAGITFGASLSGSLGLAGLAGGGVVGGLGTSLGVSSQPRMTVLIERRLSEHLFLGFGAGVSFTSAQNDTTSGVGSRVVSLDGTISLRRIFNPRGVVEVSWFANVGVSYANLELHSMGVAIDPVTGMLAQNTPQVQQGSGFGLGAATGITLERELISGLALRLSSSILGIGYGGSASKTTVGEDSRESASHSFDGGLRFSPSIELRYAF